MTDTGTHNDRIARDSKIRWNDLWGGLAVLVGRSKRTCELTLPIADDCPFSFRSAWRPASPKPSAMTISSNVTCSALLRRA